MKRLIVAASLALTALLVVVTPVAAVDPAPPDNVEMTGCWAYQNVGETGDMCFVFYYNLYYATSYPAQTAFETFIVRLMNGATELYHTMPYPYFSNGYQKGAAAIYLSAADVITYGFTWGSAYTAVLTPNPLVTWSGSTPSDSSASVSWDTSTTMNAARQNLGNRILAIALLLKTAWGVNLIDAKDGINYYLTVPTPTQTGSGQEYFQSVLPNIRTLCPQIIQADVNPPLYPTTIIPTTYAPNELPIDPTAGAAIFGMSANVFKTLLGFLGVAIFTFWLIAKVPEMTRFILYIDGVMVIFFTRIGAIVPLWATIVFVAAWLIIGYMIFYEKSYGAT